MGPCTLIPKGEFCFLQLVRPFPFLPLGNVVFLFQRKNRDSVLSWSFLLLWQSLRVLSRSPSSLDGDCIPLSGLHFPLSVYMRRNRQCLSCRRVSPWAKDRVGVIRSSTPCEVRVVPCVDSRRVGHRRL